MGALRWCGIEVSDVRCPSEGPGEIDAAGSTRETDTRLLDRLEAGSSAVAFGAAVSWCDFAPLVVKPDSSSDRRRGRGNRLVVRPQWHSVLDNRVPNLRYIHLLRRDKEALERVGRSRQQGDSAPAERTANLRADDWNWIGFFTWARIEPLTVAYEELLADPAAAISKVLTFLKLEPFTQLDFNDAALHSEALSPVARMDPPLGGRQDAPAPTSTRRTDPGRPSVSIVVVSHNEGEKLPLTVSGIRATVADDVQIIVVDDDSTDDSVSTLDPQATQVIRTPVRAGVTGARNAGAAHAQGDIIVFADAHVDPSPGWLDALCSALSERSVGCAGPTITQIHQRTARGHGFTWREAQLRMAWLRSADPAPHEVPFICGCLMAFRRADFEAVGGFDPGMVRWGSEDAEICLHLWRRGQSSVVVPSVQVAHLFRPISPYEVPPHLVVHNALRLATTHLPPSAVGSVITAFKDLPTFPAAYAQLVDSDVWQRREWVSQRVRHDGAWFLDYFRIDALR
jgi:glycosyltransferase involved in cell wall biosynthesis